MPQTNNKNSNRMDAVLSRNPITAATESLDSRLRGQCCLACLGSQAKVHLVSLSGASAMDHKSWNHWLPDRQATGFGLGTGGLIVVSRHLARRSHLTVLQPRGPPFLHNVIITFSCARDHVLGVNPTTLDTFEATVMNHEC